MRFSHFTLCFVVLLVFLPTFPAENAGINSRANNGCICHGASDSTTEVILHNLPNNWTANSTYNLSIEIIGESSDNSGENFGGFRLLFSHGELVGGDDVQSMDDGMTHTSDGNDQRTWDVQWISPEDDRKIAHITLHGNAVNGDGSTTGDAWSSWETDLWGVNATEADVPDKPDAMVFIALGVVIIGLGFAYHFVAVAPKKK